MRKCMSHHMQMRAHLHVLRGVNEVKKVIRKALPPLWRSMPFLCPEMVALAEAVRARPACLNLYAPLHPAYHPTQSNLCTPRGLQ